MGQIMSNIVSKKLMLHINFQQLSDFLMGNTTYVEAYQQFLLSANVPSSLEEDICRLEVEQPTEDESEEVYLFFVKSYIKGFCCTITGFYFTCVA